MIDYPLGFLREIDGIVKDEILKGFIDAIFENSVDVETIPDEKLRKNWIRLLSEADLAAASMEGKLASIHSGVNRERRRKKGKTVKERARKAGLITLTPNVPKGKLILE